MNSTSQHLNAVENSQSVGLLQLSTPTLVEHYSSKIAEWIFQTGSRLFISLFGEPDLARRGCGRGHVGRRPGFTRSDWTWNSTMNPQLSRIGLGFEFVHEAAIPQLGIRMRSMLVEK